MGAEREAYQAWIGERHEDEAALQALGIVVTRLLADVDDQRVGLLRLRVLEGRSWREIGTRLGVSASAAKRRYQRLQVHLARTLAAVWITLPEGAQSALTHRLGDPEVTE